MADFFGWEGGWVGANDNEPFRKFLESRSKYKKRQKKYYLHRASYHEAGHAVIAALQGAVINSVVISESDATGRTSVMFEIPKFLKRKSDPEVEIKKIFKKRLEVHLAGLVAEDIKFGKAIFAGGRTDLRNFHIEVGGLLRTPATGSQVLEARKYYWKVCHQHLQENWEWVERVAGKLLHHKCLSHEEVKGCRPSQVVDSREEPLAKVISVDFSNKNRIFYDDIIA